jgi:hypothetical protein
MNVELFKDAIAIIAGIPYKQVSLRNWQKDMHPFRSRTVHQTHRIDCGTVCCAAGWLALDPAMQDAGLRAGYDGRPVFGILESYAALSAFFGTTREETEALFDRRRMIETVEFGESASDKEVWLRRVETLTASRKRFREFFILQVNGRDIV